MAFDSKSERDEYREKIWKESGHQTNLIDCKRSKVVEFFGNDFFVAANKEIYSEAEHYYFELEMKERNQ